jgi:hypothetical protein
MPFVISTFDKPNTKHIRDKLRQRHLEYLESQVGRIIAGGGFFNQDGSLVIGGMLIVDVDTREQADAFIKNDPFSSEDLFERVEIVRWKASFFDHKRLAPVPARS